MFWRLNQWLQIWNQMINLMHLNKPNQTIKTESYIGTNLDNYWPHSGTWMWFLIHPVEKRSSILAEAEEGWSPWQTRFPAQSRAELQLKFIRIAN